jgi:hypothetical protein
VFIAPGKAGKHEDRRIRHYYYVPRSIQCHVIAGLSSRHVQTANHLSIYSFGNSV